jgi:hypothetical protein
VLVRLVTWRRLPYDPNLPVFFSGKPLLLIFALRAVSRATGELTAEGILQKLTKPLVLVIQQEVIPKRPRLRY